MSSLLSHGYALVVNADPLTGRPAVLGELAHDLAALDTFGVPWRRLKTAPLRTLRDSQPELYAEIVGVVCGHQAPAQWLLHYDAGGVRLLERTPLPLSSQVELRYFHALLAQGVIGKSDFLRAARPEALSLARASLNQHRNGHLKPVTKGVAISGGPAKGLLADSAHAAGHAGGRRGGPFIALVDRVEGHHTALLNEPDCAGVIALRGSPADHFALMAREKNFPYMVLEAHSSNGAGLRCPDRTLPFETLLTVDFSTGQVYEGDGVINWEAADPAVETLGQVLSEYDSPIRLRLNVDSADDFVGGLPREASGVGLVRTEHMLRRGDKHATLRRFMESAGPRTGQEELAELSAFFEGEFWRLLASARGLPVAVRLLDYPLHELGGELASEVNPMLGLRGVRQGLRWPQLYALQIKALLRAATAARRQGVAVCALEIMIPLVGCVEEVRVVRRWVEHALASEAAGGEFGVKVGAMIETPAAALSAGALARECDFLSFGTNDLTQLCLGLSRDDYPPVLAAYREHGLLDEDPYRTLHPAVFRLVHDAARRAKQARPSVTLGICGAHAADPQVLKLCEAGALDYLSLPEHLLRRVKLQAIQSLTPCPDPAAAAPRQQTTTGR